MVKEVNVSFELAGTGDTQDDIAVAFAGIVHDTLLTVGDSCALDARPDPEYAVAASTDVVNQTGYGPGYDDELSYAGYTDAASESPAAGDGGSGRDGGDVPPIDYGFGGEGGFEEPEEGPGDRPERSENDPFAAVDEEYTTRAVELWERTGITFATHADETRHVNLIANYLRARDEARMAAAESAQSATDADAKASTSPEPATPAGYEPAAIVCAEQGYAEALQDTGSGMDTAHHTVISPPRHPLPIRGSLHLNSGPVPFGENRHENTRAFWVEKISTYQQMLASEVLTDAQRLAYRENIVLARQRMNELPGGQIEAATRSGDRPVEPLDQELGITPSLLEGPAEMESFVARFREWSALDSARHHNQQK